MSEAGYARHLCVSVDIQGYGGHDDRYQDDLQLELVRLLDGAARSAGLDRGTWRTQGAGDGELSLIPLDGAEPRVVDDFVRHLDHELDRRNRHRRPAVQIRMRVAIHQGVGYPAASGYAGAAVVVVSRLVDCDAVRAALIAAPTANLVLIVSDGVYQDVVRNGHTTYLPSEFRQVSVAVKELTTSAWLWVPNHDVHGLTLSHTRAPVLPLTTKDAVAGSGGTVSQAERDVRVHTSSGPKYDFHAPVDGRYATFGPVFGRPDRGDDG